VDCRSSVCAALLVLLGCSAGSDQPEARQADQRSGQVPDLISATVHRILEHYGDDIDAAELPEAHGVVLMVHHAHVVLMDGGFYSLFTSEFPGDPDYQLRLKALETIGASRACEAFRRAFAAFPNATLPRDFEDGFGRCRPCT